MSDAPLLDCEPRYKHGGAKLALGTFAIGVLVCCWVSSSKMLQQLALDFPRWQHPYGLAILIQCPMVACLPVWFALRAVRKPGPQDRLHLTVLRHLSFFFVGSQLQDSVQVPVHSNVGTALELSRRMLLRGGLICILCTASSFAWVRLRPERR